MSRPNRQLRKSYKVFCEGDTEYNYIEGLRKQRRLHIRIKTIDMQGGGYKNFLRKIRQESEANCLAKFILIDGDRAENDELEKKNLLDIINYCKVQNESKRCPHILIVNHPDFEYVGCSHSIRFRGQNTNAFIKDQFNYNSLDEFKSDNNIFAVLTKGDNSIDNMLNALRTKPHVVKNTIRKAKELFSVAVEGPILDDESFGKKGSNMEDFYKVINMFE